MDALTHVFLPLTVAYAVRPGLFAWRPALALGGVGLVPDFDKLLGVSGAFHSLAFVAVASALAVLVGRWADRRAYALIVVALLCSHLLLDIIDGGPVPLLYPLLGQGIGLEYLSQLVRGVGPFGTTVEGLVPGLRVDTPNPNRRSFPLYDGFGVASVVSFLAVYVGIGRWGER